MSTRSKIKMTHELRYDVWFRDRNDDWDTRPSSQLYWSAASAQAAAERLRNAPGRYTNITVAELKEPIEVDDD